VRTTASSCSSCRSGCATRRRAAWRPQPPAFARGYAKLYTEHVLGAERGADFDFLVGGSGSRVMTTLIYGQFTNAFNWPLGSALAMVLSVASLGGVALLAWLFGAGLVIDLFVILAGELAVPHASEIAARAAHDITRGRYRYWFWLGAILLGGVGGGPIDPGLTPQATGFRPPGAFRIAPEQTPPTTNCPEPEARNWLRDDIRANPLSDRGGPPPPVRVMDFDRR